VKEFIFKERRRFSLTRKDILTIRRTLFGNLKELNDAFTDYQVMKLVLAVSGITEGLPHGPSMNFGVVPLSLFFSQPA